MGVTLWLNIEIAYLPYFPLRLAHVRIVFERVSWFNNVCIRILYYKGMGETVAPLFKIGH
jgi:hypothetical protein